MISIQKRKISIIGSGQIGTIAAYLAGSQNVAEEVVLYDIKKGLPQGKALDISQSIAGSSQGVNVIGANEISDIKDSNVIIITAGMPRKPGMTRDDLIQINAKIIQDLANNIKQYAPNAFIIVITNPLDLMTALLLKTGNFKNNQVVGMAGELDSARFKYFLSQELKIHHSTIHNLIIGNHNDAMIPLISHTSIAGIPLQHFIDEKAISIEKINEIIERTKKGGAEIVKLMESSAYINPASSAIKMAKSYLSNLSLVFSASIDARLIDKNNEFCFIGYPVKINHQGLQTIKINLSNDEESKFNSSMSNNINMLAKL